MLAPVMRNFQQVDVFGDEPYFGNPLAVVLDADGIDDAALLRFSQWTNLSETTFIVPTTNPEADYRVRIFTPNGELPFAGHPTLGPCHTWLRAGGQPSNSDHIVQECGAGLVRIRQTDDGLAFAAPPLVRSGDVESELIAHIATILHIDEAEIVDSQWVDNGPGWVAVLLRDAQAVLELQPGYVDIDLGVAGLHPAGHDIALEVRSFFPVNGATVEDPVTGSLNASLAQWLLATGRLSAPYTASQGTTLGRKGRVHISQDPDGTIWVAGNTSTCIEGTVDL